MCGAINRLIPALSLGRVDELAKVAIATERSEMTRYRIPHLAAAKCPDRQFGIAQSKLGAPIHLELPALDRHEANLARAASEIAMAEGDPADDYQEESHDCPMH
jgi:hypothetical protein